MTMRAVVRSTLPSMAGWRMDPWEVRGETDPRREPAGAKSALTAPMRPPRTPMERPRPRTVQQTRSSRDPTRGSTVLRPMPARSTGRRAVVPLPRVLPAKFAPGSAPPTRRPRANPTRVRAALCRATVRTLSCARPGRSVSATCRMGWLPASMQVRTPDPKAGRTKEGAPRVCLDHGPPVQPHGWSRQIQRAP